MNTKGIKFLAVLAVLAMAFAACAVVIESADAGDDLTGRDEKGLETTGVPLEKDSKIVLYPTKGTDINVDGSNKTYIATISGYAANNTKLDPAMWGATTGYAFFDVSLNGIALKAGDAAVWMYQKSTALSLATDKQSATTKAVSGSPYTERINGWTYAGTFNVDHYDNDLQVLIPQDGSDVVLEFYSVEAAPTAKEATFDQKAALLADSTKATLLASITIKTNVTDLDNEITPVVTVVDLDGLTYPKDDYKSINPAYKDWSFKSSTLSGTFGSNVKFYGDAVKAGTGINDAIMTEAGFTVKLVQNSTTTYYSDFEVAIADVAYDAAAITLLADDWSYPVVYDAKKSLTIDLNSKELTFINNGEKTEGLFQIINAEKAVKISNGTITCAPNLLVDETALSLIENFNTDTELSNVNIDAVLMEGDAAYKWSTVLFNRNGTLTLSGKTTVTSGLATADLATYAIVSDSFNHTHEGVKYTGSVVKVASSDVTVAGDMLVSYSNTEDVGAWAGDALTGKGFDISAGSFAGTLTKGKITITSNYAIGDYATATYADDMTFALSGGKFTDYSALKYVVADKSITIDQGGKDVPAEKAKDATVAGGTATIDTSDLKTGEANTFIVASAGAITKLEADAKTNDIVIIGTGQPLSGVDLKVNGTGAVALTGFTTITGTVTTGTGTSAQVVKLTGVSGTFTISEGSIVVNADWTGGTIELSNDQVLKLSGTVTGADNKIIMKEGQTKGAKVVIEAGLEKALLIGAEAKLVIGQSGDLKEKIDVEVEGALAGLGDLDLQYAKSVTVKDGGELAILGTFTEAKTNTVYSGGDINSLNTTAIEKWKGKDAASGTWSIAKSGTGADEEHPALYTLTLNNYNGTYNFAAIPEISDGAGTVKYAGLKEILLNGDSVITYKMDEIGLLETLFGGAGYLTSITTEGAGSLTIAVDISEVEGADLDNGLAVIAAGNLKVNGVGLAIAVTGSNAEWTADETDDMAIVAIYAGTLDFYDAPTIISVMSHFDSDTIIGVLADGKVTVTGNTLVVSAQNAMGTILRDVPGLEVKSAIVALNGDVHTTDVITVSNKSTLAVSGLFWSEGNINVSQESELSVVDGHFDGTIKNSGKVEFSGKVKIDGAINNLAVMNNTGVIGVYGAFSNTTPGVFTNDGTLNVYAMDAVDDEALFSIDDTKAAPTTNNVKLKTIVLDDIEAGYDGALYFDATITVYKAIGYAAVDDLFKGTIVPAVNGGYTLTMSSTTATITIVYDPAETKGILDTHYAMTVTGTVKIADESYYLTPNTTTKDKEAELDEDSVKNCFGAAAEADFYIASGTVNNNGTVVVSHTIAEVGPVAADIIINADATFNGNITTNIEKVTIKGTLKGDLTANGAGEATVANTTGNVTANGKVTVASSKTMTGNIVAKDDVDIKGTLNGNIATTKNVSIAKMVGDVTVTRANADVDAKTITVTDESNINVIYISKYKETKTATETKDFTAKMTIAGTPKGTGLKIDLAKGSDATDSAAAVGGYFRILETAALADEKFVNVTLTEGRLYVDSVTTIEQRYYITIEAGTTIEVNKYAASLDVKNAGLKVSKDATANFETGAGVPVNYGKVLFIMSFTIEDGAYTIYSDVAYALANCDEGATLTVGESATIDQGVSVKAGVNIIVKDVTLTFNGKNVKMEEGAKITLDGTGKVIFKQSTDNTGDAKRTANEFYSVSGTIVYGENAILFSEARFTEDSTIAGVAATSTAAAMISATLLYNEGMATITEGTGTGTITLLNASYAMTKGSDELTPVSAGFTVMAEAVFNATNIYDAAGSVKYKASGDDFVVKDTLLIPTSVIIVGTLNLANDTTIKGSYLGGIITLAAGKTLTIPAGDAPAEDDEPKTVAPVVAMKLIDTTDNENGYTLLGVAASYGENVYFKATKYKDTNVMTVRGDIKAGAISATTDAYIDTVTLQKDATIFADVACIIGESDAKGLLAAKEMHMKVDGVTSEWKVLTYQVTYEEDGYTVYTYFNNVDFDVISDIELSGNENNYNLGAITGAAAGAKVDLSGNDVNIIIPEGKTLTVDRALIIGTPITELGDGEGSSISGKVIITDKNYIVAYVDVDLDDAEIEGKYVAGDQKLKAVYSILDIEDVPYAYIIAAEKYSVPAEGIVAGIQLSVADKGIVPQIAGYNFTKWYNYDETNASYVGETNAYAGAKATTVFVTVKFAEGVSYYCDGAEFAIYDTPVKVEYNSVFTAKINNTAKYEGTPLINGKNSFIVTEDSTLTVTGVNPIPVPPEPTPEPEVGDSGLSLTDILLIVLVVLIAIMVVILVLRLNRS